MRNFLTRRLGTLGIILWYILTAFISILPFVFIDLNFVWTFILILIDWIFPFVSPVFWIWGLVKAIKGPQDIWAIVYYVSFAILFLPYVIDLFYTTFSPTYRANQEAKKWLNNYSEVSRLASLPDEDEDNR